jgi:ubiquinone/menaquinone biosynthesis C-methylase UbiE
MLKQEPVSVQDLGNVDPLVARGFGYEWTRFDQASLDPLEKQRIFEEYFAIFPWQELPPDAVGADFGCGSGRWASVVAARVGHLYCIDASVDALNVAKRNLREHANCTFVAASVGRLELLPQGLDFGYSLGVLHHVPDTLAGLRSCVATLKPGAPFLIYLYYRFDHRPVWFRLLWVASDLLRRFVSKLPYGARFAASETLAALVYWPLARTAKLLEHLGASVGGFPLSYYRDKSFYVMRTDALDRFGTRLEQRFTRAEIEKMMLAAGLRDIRFRDPAPFWCAVGRKQTTTTPTLPSRTIRT